jgi:ABC-type dipeptide/oligopeptide/nickel transport system permease component
VRLTRQISFKLLRLVGAVFAVSLLTFLLAHKIPGDPTAIILQDKVNQMVPCGDALLGQPVDCSELSDSVLHPRGTEAPGAIVSVCKADECVIASDALRHQLDLDEPILTQYFHWLGNALQGDFGVTYDTQPQPVWPQIAEAIPPTLELMIMAMILSLVIAIPLGIYGA